jgi:FkbM family methyltransferase
MLRRLAKAIRHHPMLRDADGLWNALRRPYRLALGFGGRGTKVSAGGKVAICVPPDLSYWDLENYEPEGIEALSQWMTRHRGGVFIDIGSALGLYSACAMFLDPASEVIAVDGDIESVAATRRFCRYAPAPSRLTVIHGLITDEAPHSSLARAITETEAKIAASGARGNLAHLQFSHLDSGFDETPRYRLDDLLAIAGDRPTLIKCDVEGAELLVLRGAARFLSKTRCDLLLSVHPWNDMKARYGYSVDDVREFLENLGYRIDVLAVDYEEHWWCTQRPA